MKPSARKRRALLTSIIVHASAARDVDVVPPSCRSARRARSIPSSAASSIDVILARIPFRLAMTVACLASIPAVSRRAIPARARPSSMCRGAPPASRRSRRSLVTLRASLPDTAAIAEDGVEGYVRILELAYGDEALGNEVRDRMGEDRQFSIGIRQAMTDTNYTDRLRAAIDASPYMQAAAKEAVRRRADGDAVQAVMGDDTIRDQIEAMSSNPEVLRQTQEQSEGLLKKVAAELVDGVKEYREEFEPDADDLIQKFSDIAERGYEAFIKYSMNDVKVKNAIINALYDEMEEAQADAAKRVDDERA